MYYGIPLQETYRLSWEIWCNVENVSEEYTMYTQFYTELIDQLIIL